VKNRRSFLSGLLSAGVAGGVADRLPGQQSPIVPPSQDKKQPMDAGPETPPIPGAEKRILEENQKDIKKKVQKLYELATELKDEVEKTDSSKVLSLSLVRKAEEIEKLAHDIKNRSKG
jgi:hypothetical protein